MEKKLFSIAMILLLSLSILAVFKTGMAKTAVDLTLPDAELNNAEFTRQWGGTLVSKIDVTGPGVEFDLSGLSPSSGSGYGDNFPVNQLAGGDLYNSHYGDFRKYTDYRMAFKNKGTNDVTIHLFMNTGYTGDGHPNTFWKGTDVTVVAGHTEIVTMDFLNAICYGAINYTDDTSHPIYYLHEVSNIGFEVLAGGDGTASLIAFSETDLYVDPLTVVKTIGTDHVGDTFEVTVKVDNVIELYGLDIKMTWDDALISYDHESYATLLSAIWGPTEDTDWHVLTHEGSVGYYRFIAVSLGNSYTGSAGLFKVGFKIKDPNTNSMKQTSIHFDIQKLSDKASQNIAHDTEDGTYQVWGQAPTLSMTQAGISSRTCRKTDESFTVTIGITGAASITDFNFEVDYDSAMLDYVSYTVQWGSGNVPEGPTGTLIGTTSSTSGPQSGPITLVTLTFKSDPGYKQIWKDPSTGQLSNLFTSTIGIKFMSATLKFTSPQPDLTYTRGEPSPHKINPPSDISYTFYPIKGDLNNDGAVLIFDLTAVAGKYDTTDFSVNLIGADGYIDIFDLVIVASNFWYSYP